MVRFLLYPLLLIFCVNCNSTDTSTTESTSAKPNILFIFTDDQSYTAVAALGNKQIKTPNLDRLVNSGVTFTHAYNMGAWHGAVCVASRTMINSGQSVFRAQDVVKQWHDGDEAAIANNWAPLMKAAGYKTYFSGKWHVDGLNVNEQFDTTSHLRPGMPSDGYPHSKVVALAERHGGNPPIDSLLALWPPGYHRPLSEEDASWDPTDIKYGGYWQGGRHWSEVLADDAAAYLNQAKDEVEPFFMYLAFNAPHDPRQAPKEFEDMYTAKELTLPANYLAEYPHALAIGNGPTLRDEALAPFPRSEMAVRQHLKEYYASVSHVDAQIGKILDALEATGQADNTVIMFTADHGIAMGSHGLLGKQNMYDHSSRVPLMLAGPGIPAGMKIDTDVYLQDLMPTALELAGANIPDNVFYHSLLPRIDGDPASPYDAIFGSYVNYQRAIRKDGYKLIAYPDAGVLRLYNLEADPLEVNDLAGMEPEKKEALFRDLVALQQSLGDTLALDWTNYQ